MSIKRLRRSIRYTLTNSAPKEENDDPTKQLLEHYSARHDWLKDSHFLKELEGDSVDTEILDEELNSIQEEQPITCRGKTWRVLESNPIQILLCVLVLIDAAVVISEILIDLHAIRSQYLESQDMLKQAIRYLNHSYGDVIDIYGAGDMHDILAALEKQYPMHNKKRHKRERPADRSFTYHEEQGLSMFYERESDFEPNDHATINWIPPPKIGNNSSDFNNNITEKQNHISVNDDDKSTIGYNNKIKQTSHNIRLRYSRDTGEKENSTEQAVSKPPNKQKKHAKAEKLLKIAHILHYCSIAILGIFVIQFLIKMVCMGVAFFKDKLEMFDAVIISASFCLDVIFLDGSFGGATGDETAALLIVFLLWRLLRVVNGLMVTSKKRQEFRIKLQKRARRKAEKRSDLLDEDRQYNQKEIDSLRKLCYEKGAIELEVSSCKPRRRKAAFEKKDTSAGISSIAALSLGFSMSMSGATNATLISNPPPKSPAAFHVRNLIQTPDQTKIPPKRRAFLSVAKRKNCSISLEQSFEKSPQTSVEMVSPLGSFDYQNSDAPKSSGIKLKASRADTVLTVNCANDEITDKRTADNLNGNRDNSSSCRNSPSKFEHSEIISARFDQNQNEPNEGAKRTKNTTPTSTTDPKQTTSEISKDFRPPCMQYRSSFPSDDKTKHGSNAPTPLCANKRFLFANRSYPSIGKRRTIQHEPVRFTESDNSLVVTETIVSRQVKSENLEICLKFDSGDGKNGHAIVQMDDEYL